MNIPNTNGHARPGPARRLAAGVAAIVGTTGLLLTTATPAPATTVAPDAAIPTTTPSTPTDATVVNPSFEETTGSGIPGWNPLWPSSIDYYSLSTQRASHGETSLHMLDTSTNGGGGLVSDGVPVAAGDTYEFAFDMYLNSGALNPTVYFDGADGSVISQPYQTTRTTIGTWERASMVVVAPERAVRARPTIYTSSGAMVDAYVDNVSMAPKAEEPPPEPFDPETIVSQDPAISYLGTPVTSKITTNSVLGEEDGRAVTYGAYRGHPDTANPCTLVVADANTGEVIRTLPLAGAEGNFEIRKATDGKVYIGTNHDYKLWRYDPDTAQVTDLGLINPDSPGDGYPITMTAGPNGTMYIGAYPKGYLYLYDPADDSITNLGAVDPTQAYVRALAYDFARDTLYVGVGGTRAQIYKLESDGTKTALITEENAPGFFDETFVNTFTFTGDRLFARTVSSELIVLRPDDTVEYWKGEGREAFGYHVSARPDAPGKFVFGFGTRFWEYDSATATTRDLGITTNTYLNDSRWIQLDDPEWPGYSMLAATQGGSVLMNPTTGRSELHTVDFANPVTVQKILTGPDSMYASGYMVGLAPFDSVTGEIGTTMQSGQFESSAVRDGKMLLGTYGNGRLMEYDPATGAAPRQIFDLKAEAQDRPFAMDYDEENDRVFMGTVPYYGTHQGAVTMYDFATRTKTVFTTEIVAEQSVISVLYHDGLLYVGTTLDGGLGAPPSGQTEAHFVVFDPDTGQKVHDFVPVAGDEGVTGLMVGPDGLIWGVSEDTVFKYDPEPEEIVYSEKLLRARYGSGTVWAFAFLVTGADGNVYGTNRSSLFRIDPDTMEYTQLVNGFGNYANVDAHGDVLFSSGVHLFTYDVTDAPVCDATVTGTHAGPLNVAEGTTCVEDATVVGPVTVGAGAGIVVTDSDVTGPVRATDATTVQIADTTIRGPVHVTGTTSAATLAGNRITGAVSLVDNTTEEPSVVNGNTITGPLTCSGNEPPPVNDGDANTITGPTAGQCAEF